MCACPEESPVVFTFCNTSINPSCSTETQTLTAGYCVINEEAVDSVGLFEGSPVLFKANATQKAKGELADLCNDTTVQSILSSLYLSVC